MNNLNNANPENLVHGITPQPISTPQSTIFKQPIVVNSPTTPLTLDPALENKDNSEHEGIIYKAKKSQFHLDTDVILSRHALGNANYEDWEVLPSD